MPPKTNPSNIAQTPLDSSSSSHESPRSQYSPDNPARTMATEVQTTTYSSTPSYESSGGLKLPPILPYPSLSNSPRRSPTLGSPYGSHGNQLTPTSASAFRSSLPYGSTVQGPLQMPMRPAEPSMPPLSPAIASTRSSPVGLEGQRGTKRLFEDMAVGSEGSDRAPVRLPLTSYDLREQRSTSRVLPPPMAELSSVSSASTPSGTTSSFPTLTNPAYSRRQSESSNVSNTHRLSLYMRQEPRAARAGPDGRDRRSLDPPPVVQLMINDFDPELPSDIAELKSSFVVHCRLISSQSPRKDVSTLSKVSEDGQKEIQRLLLGTAVASPFVCQDDPDPENSPSHPVTKPVSGPPSPTSRFLPPSLAKSSEGKGKEVAPPHTLPASFFIFADLSVRKAGEYRLEFNLMKMESFYLMQGGTVPIIASTTSQVFKVVNAKDFDQVQPSTNLVRGLLERGAGFPLKLKKGTREGQRRRANREGSDGNDDDDDEEEG